MARSHAYVALLRGINVGGKSRVPMGELRAVLSALGLEDVTTYVQSGNVVFRAPARDQRRLTRRIEAAVAEAFAVGPTVLLRTPQELERVAAGNPYLSADADTSKLHVVFLDRAPAAGARGKLDPDRSPPDELAVRKREIYLRLPNGAGRTKLTLDYLERTLGVRGTQRNWRTLLALIELATK